MVFDHANACASIRSLVEIHNNCEILTGMITMTVTVKMEFFWVPPEPVSGPGTGTRPGGWEPLH